MLFFFLNTECILESVFCESNYFKTYTLHFKLIENAFRKRDQDGNARTRDAHIRATRTHAHLQRNYKKHVDTCRGVPFQVFNLYFDYYLYYLYYYCHSESCILRVKKSVL